MTLKFNLSKEDYINYNLYYIKTSKQNRRVFITNKYLFPIIWLIIAFVFSIFIPDSMLVNLITWLIGTVLWLTFWPKSYYRRSRNYITKQINDGNTESLLGNKTITLNEETIDYSSENEVLSSNASYKYSSVEKIGIDYNCIFIFVSSVSAIIIPLSAFENNEQKDNFLNIVSGKSGIEILNH